MRIFNYLRNHRGQSIVETALVLPILIMIFMGIFEFGRIFNVYLVISNASREGVRSTVIGKSDAEIIQTVQNTAATLDLSMMDITIAPSGSNRTRGVQASVEINYDLPLIFPTISGLMPNPLTLTAKTVMRIE